MEDGGVHPIDKLNVVKEKDSTTVTLKKPTKESHEWESITVILHNVKAVIFTPIGKHGNPLEEPKIQKVTDSSKPVEIILPASLKAAGYVIEVVPATPSKPATIEVVSVVACVSDEETTTVAATTASATTHGATTALPVTTSAPVTTSHPVTTLHPVSTPAPVTTSAPTVAATTTTLTKSPCTTYMQDQGVIPKSSLSVTRIDGQTSSIITARSPTPGAEFVSFNFKGTNVKTISYTVTDQDGTVEPVKTITVDASTGLFTVTLDKPTPLSRIVFTVTPATAQTTDVDIVSAIACVPSTATDTTTAVPATSVASTTTSGTTLPGTTAAHTTPGSGITTTTSSTVPTTGTPGTTTPHPASKLPCMQQMNNQGTVHKDKLTIVKAIGADSIKLTAGGKNNIGVTPVWVAVKLHGVNLQEVTFTPVNKQDKPIGEVTTKTVSAETKSITITLLTPVQADKFTILVKRASPQHFDIEIVSVEACIYYEDETTPFHTTSAPTTPIESLPPTTPLRVTTLPPVQTTPSATPKTPPTPIPIVCKYPLEPSECLCHRTCDHMSNLESCPVKGSESCHRGCQCPAGTVMLNGTCTKEMDCPCLYNGKFYKYQEKIPMPGVECTHMICTHEGMKKTVDEHCKPQVACTGGRTFQTCPCERNCHEDSHVCDKSTCTPRCACPADTVWNNVECVPRSMCTCKEGNTTYTNGQSWDVGHCTQCHCVEGREMCSEICRLTDQECRKQGKKLFNKDLSDSTCCRCVSDEPHCMYKDQEKEIGAVWHEGLCKHFTCTKTASDVGMIVMTQTECPACEANEQKEYVANKCCPVCRKKAVPPETPLTPKTPKTPKAPHSEPCQELMKDPLFLDDRVELHPAHKGTPHDLKHEGKGWPVHQADKPTITLDLSTDLGTRAGELKKLVIDGNVKAVTIKYTSVRPRGNEPEKYQDYNEGKLIDVEGKEIVLTDKAHNNGLTVLKVQITVVMAIRPVDPINLKLKVFACIEDAPEPCDESVLEELVCTDILKLASDLPDHRITILSAKKVSPADLRSTGKGLPVSEADKPEITINLSSHDNVKPGLIEKLEILGNVKTVTIEYRTPESEVDGFKPYKNGKPIDVEKDEVIFTSEFSKKGGLIVHEIRVTPLKPIVAGKPYNMKMKVYACVDPQPDPEDELEYVQEGPCLVPAKSNDKHEPTKHHKEHQHPNIGCVDIMADPHELPDKQIKLTPAGKGTPEQLRPEGSGWPTEKVERPVINVNLVSSDNRRPALLKGIKVPGNVKEVLIKYRPIRPHPDRKLIPTEQTDPEGFMAFNDGKPVDVTNSKIVFKNPKTDEPGVMAYDVQVTLLTPIKPDQPFNAKLKVFACIQEDLEFFTTDELKAFEHRIEEAKHAKHHAH
jgi:hypothetical protein